MFLRPPDDPSSLPTPSFAICDNRFKLRRLNDVEEGNATIHTLSNNLSSEPETSLGPQTTEPTPEGMFLEETKQISAKSELYKFCGVRHWKPPAYDCFDNEGPCNKILFTGKVTIEMEEASQVTFLECCGDPQPKKKVATEQAAEAALWYLQKLGYNLHTEKASSRRRKQTNPVKDESTQTDESGKDGKG